MNNLQMIADVITVRHEKSLGFTVVAVNTASNRDPNVSLIGVFTLPLDESLRSGDHLRVTVETDW